MVIISGVPIFRIFTVIDVAVSTGLTVYSLLALEGFKTNKEKLEAPEYQ